MGNLADVNDAKVEMASLWGKLLNSSSSKTSAKLLCALKNYENP